MGWAGAVVQPPVVVIPGITATSLIDRYEIDPNNLWTALLRKEYDRIALHPDDLRYEAIEPARVQAGNIFAIVYDDLVKALRHELSPREDRPTPVFPFPYDWRQSLDRVGSVLDEMIEEVIARTALLRHYRGFSERPQVDLVGHSMGGLVICEYLHAHGEKQRVRRIATIGTPFRGSIEAVVKLVTGLGNLSGDPPSAREREAARVTPSLYQLLPSYEGALRNRESGEDVSLFDAEAWQESIVASLAEFIRLRSPESGNATTRAERALGLLGRLLGEAEQHRSRVGSLRLDRAGLEPEDWLAIAGVDSDTRVEVFQTTERGRRRFEFRDDQWVNQGPGSHRTGDGTVPVDSAIPGFLGARRVVGVTPSDLGRLEVRDRALLGTVGFHALLPNLNLVQRLLAKHFRPSFNGPVAGQPVAGVNPSEWNPPFRI